MIAPGAAPRAAAGPREPWSAAWEFAALGIALTLVVAWMARLPSWYRDLGPFQGLYGVAFALYALALARLPRYAALPRAGWVVFGVAAACRVLLVPLAPSLSGDLYRYVWEGMVWLHGGNPYAQSPLDPALAALRTPDIHPFVNHPELATIYPPLAEAGFALVAAISPTVLAMKLWVALHDLALAGVLALLAAGAGRRPAWALAYAWNPLVLVEYAGTGHNDPTALLGLALAFLWRRERPVLSAMALGWGALTKLAPLLALPFLWRDWTRSARAIALAVLVPGLSAFWVLTRAPDSGLHAFATQWRNNELIFHLIERATGSFTLARGLVIAALAGVAGLLWWRRRPSVQATRALNRIALVSSPVVHPWYAGWALMFEPLGPSAAWLALSALMILNYGFLRTPDQGRSFHPPLSWRWIEYGVPVLIGAGVRLARWKPRRAEGIEGDVS